MSNLLELIKDVKLKGHSVNSKWHQNAVNEGVKSRRGAAEYGQSFPDKSLRPHECDTDLESKYSQETKKCQDDTINSLLIFCVHFSCFSTN